MTSWSAGRRLAVFAAVILLGCAATRADSESAARRYVGEPKGALTLSMGLAWFAVAVHRQRSSRPDNVIDIRAHLQADSFKDASGNAAGEAFERRLAA